MASLLSHVYDFFKCGVHKRAALYRLKGWCHQPKLLNYSKRPLVFWWLLPHLKCALRSMVVIFFYGIFTQVSEYTISPLDGACDQDRWLVPLIAHQILEPVPALQGSGAFPGILEKIFGTRGWVWNSRQILVRIGTSPLVPLLARLWAPLLMPIGAKKLYSVGFHRLVWPPWLVLHPIRA